MSDTRTMNSAEVKIRAGYARKFLDGAKDLRIIWDENDTERNESEMSVVIGSLCVLSAIAAADTICGKRLGYCSKSRNHSDAIRVLSQVNSKYSQLLSTLLNEKDNLNYSTQRTSLKKADNLLRKAENLVKNMEEELRQ